MDIEIPEDLKTKAIDLLKSFTKSCMTYDKCQAECGPLGICVARVNALSEALYKERENKNDNK